MCAYLEGELARERSVACEELLRECENDLPHEAPDAREDTLRCALEEGRFSRKGQGRRKRTRRRRRIWYLSLVLL
jgi:hypothetical protein